MTDIMDDTGNVMVPGTFFYYADVCVYKELCAICPKIF
jgi:hypothetical protein